MRQMDDSKAHQRAASGSFGLRSAAIVLAGLVMLQTLCGCIVVGGSGYHHHHGFFLFPRGCGLFLIIVVVLLLRRRRYYY